MNNGQMAEMKETMNRQAELMRMNNKTLADLLAQVGELAEGYRSALAKLAALEKRNDARMIFERLVQRGTITREEMERALAS